MKFLLAVLTLPMALIATGCNPMSDPKNPKLNPHSKQAYEITVRIDGAPGPFDSVTGGAAYSVINASDCVPQDPLSGAHPAPGYDAPAVLSRVNNDIYKGTICLDLLRDENYYMKGSCHWEFVGFGATLKVHGANFRTVVSRADIVSGKKIVEYQQVRLYLDKSATDMNILSEPLSDDMSKHLDTFFAVIVTAKEIRHE